jgi:hypothetical protein
MGGRLTRSALVTMLCLCAGCSYCRHRGEDFLDMVDLGISYSRKPQFGLYAGLFMQGLTVGYTDVDGGFIGLGDRRLGVMKFHQDCVGLVVWGWEEFGYEDYDLDDPRTVRFQHTNIIGLVQGLFDGTFPQPDYFVARTGHIHLGWIGVVAALRYYQIADFILGWTTLDIGFDDGERRGRWFGKPLFWIDSELKPPPSPPSPES